jgi:ubiquinone/menaquinone biosynthesis C-methylase UbiE
MIDGADFRRHYAFGLEKDRLAAGAGLLERLRTEEIIRRHLPRPGALVLDVGGGPGVYATWLAREGYTVHLIDPVAVHLEQAEEASRRQSRTPLAGVHLGDARHLAWPDGSVEVVLLLGPLYHLTVREDRLRALQEAARVLAPGGVMFVAAISRFASLLDGFARQLLGDPTFAAIVERDLAEGQHRNPTERPDYFTTAYFHHPGELRAELFEAGLAPPEVLAVEGPLWLLPSLDHDLGDFERRERLLASLRRIEAEPSLLGASAHLLAIARRR